MTDLSTIKELTVAPLTEKGAISEVSSWLRSRQVILKQILEEYRSASDENDHKNGISFGKIDSKPLEGLCAISSDIIAQGIKKKFENISVAVVRVDKKTSNTTTEPHHIVQLSDARSPVVYDADATYCQFNERVNPEKMIVTPSINRNKLYDTSNIINTDPEEFHNRNLEGLKTRHFDVDYYEGLIDRFINE